MRTLFLVLGILVSWAAPLRAEEKKAAPPVEQSLADLCIARLKSFPGKHDAKTLAAACEKVEALDGCHSVAGEKIFHFDRVVEGKNIKKILVFALIHGDELPAGSVGRAWMQRLTTIEPRNTWRVVPLLNPDGYKNKTRFNGRGVDLNRNFPTKDWEEAAIPYWEKSTKKDKRRYPGPHAGSEPETNCAIKHIEDFKPTFVISIHTPYAVLDFDGPRIKVPNFKQLPWKSLGNYPGSLGRFMWTDRNQPVLTIELQQSGYENKLDYFDNLQDISGKIAIEAENTLNSKPDAKPEKHKEKPAKK